MKALVKIVVLSVVLSLGSAIFPKEVAAQEQVNDFGVFYDELGPYGQWVDYPGYGYVWQPNVGPDFVPYSTAGHWVYTEYGWTWASDYNWGWAPFHYGRWNFDDNLGWLWIPGNEWGPAWVAWRSAPGYYGWAPLGPSRYGYAYDDYDNYYVPNNEWVFVQDIYIGSPYICDYYYPYYDNDDFIQYSYIDNNCYGDRDGYHDRDGDRRDHDRDGGNYRYVCGPSRDEVQRNTGNVVRQVAITSSDRPGQSIANERLSIYRPSINKVAENRQKPVPHNSVAVNQLKNSPNKNIAIQQPHAQAKNNTAYVPQKSDRRSLPVQNKYDNQSGVSHNNSESNKPVNNNEYKPSGSGYQQHVISSQSNGGYVKPVNTPVNKQEPSGGYQLSGGGHSNSGYIQPSGYSKPVNQGSGSGSSSHNSYSAPSGYSQPAHNNSSGSSRSSSGSGSSGSYSSHSSSSGYSQPSHENRSGSSRSGNSSSNSGSGSGSSGSVSHSSSSSSSSSSSKRR